MIIIIFGVLLINKKHIEINKKSINNDIIELFVNEWNFNTTEYIAESIEELYNKGCSNIKIVKKIEEYNYYACICVMDDKGNNFYCQSDMNGRFVSILNELEYKNALFFQKAFNTPTSLNYFRTASIVESCNMGQITDITNIVQKKNYYVFDFKTSNNGDYSATLNVNGGEFGWIKSNKNGKYVYEPLPE